MNPALQRMVMLKAEKTLTIISKAIRNNTGTSTSRQTLQWTLRKAGLCGHTQRRTPLLQEKHTKAWLNFAKAHLDREGDFSDKKGLLGHTDVAFVWRKTEHSTPRTSLPLSSIVMGT